MDSGPRGPHDDFFCWKFHVWYALRDCVFRHHYRTHPECADCEQGAANQRLLPRIPSKPRWMELPQLGQVWDDDEEAV